MRTENDLRDALVMLERHAPDPRRVMPPARRARRRLWVPLALAGAVGVAAAVVIALLPAATSGRQITPSRAHPAESASTIKSAILTALKGAKGDIVHMWTWTSGESDSPSGDQTWYWPWDAQAGQQVKIRFFTPENQDGSQYLDQAESYTQLADGHTPSRAQTTEIDSADHAWYQGSAPTKFIIRERQFADLTSISALESSGFTIAGHQELDGQETIVLRFRHFTVWFNSSTYLPVRSAINGTGSLEAYVSYQFLQPDPANLAQLQATVPEGFTRAGSLCDFFALEGASGTGICSQ
jgi:hypothetical protein